MSPQLREQWMRVRLRSPSYQSSQLLLSQCQRLCAFLKKGSNELRGMGHPLGQSLGSTRDSAAILSVSASCCL